jgi:CRISPR-associated protein Cmr3
MSADAWRGFRLAPDDVLFFRDGRPSSLGDDHYLASLFPPLPSTLYGALRTRRLLDEEVALDGLDRSNWDARLRGLTAELGGWGGFGSLEVRGPWLVRGESEVLLPAPHDLALVLAGGRPSEEPGAIERVLRYRPAEGGEAGGASHRLQRLAPFERTASGWREWQGADPEPPDQRFLTPEGIRRWSAGETPEPQHFVSARDLWTVETRTGVGLEKERRTSQEGRLYTFGFIRLQKGVALGFEARGTPLSADGGVRLGGEGRTARLIAGPALPLPPAPAAAEDSFRLGFFTPALSRGGAWPPGFTPASLDGRLAGQPCQLQAAVCRGAVPVGGWDLANKAPKPLRRAIPAGSVYRFTGAAAAAAAVHGGGLNDFDPEHLSRQGFGLALAARDD